MSLSGGWPCVGHAVTLALGNDLGCESGAFIVDAINCFAHHLCVCVKGAIGLFPQVTVNTVPVIRLRWQLVGFPSGNISFDEVHPYFSVFRCQMGRGKFDSVLVRGTDVSLYSQMRPKRLLSDEMYDIPAFPDYQSLIGWGEQAHMVGRQGHLGLDRTK